MEHDIILFLRPIGNAACNRDDGHKVAERRAVLSKVDKVCLALLVIGKALLHLGNCFWIGMLAMFSFRNAASRCLEETTVTANDFMLLVPCQTIEGRGSINDRTVVSPHIHHDESNRHIDGTEGHARIWSSGDTTQDG